MNRILDFQSYKRSSLYTLNEGRRDRKGVTAYMVGDSTVPSINDSIPGMARKLKDGSAKRDKVKGGLWCVGIGTPGFLKMINAYDEKHPEADYVFLAMGTNDMYQANEVNKRSAIEIRERLREIFPNVPKFYIIKGTGWGWGEKTKDNYPKWMWQGGNINNGPTTESPKEIDEYYEKVWKPAGFNVIPVQMGIIKDKDGYAKHIGPKTPGVDELSRYISGILSGEISTYREDFNREEKTPNINLKKESLRYFYDVLEDAYNENLVLAEQPDGRRTYDPVVQRAQIGLAFLGYELPSFGADGLFGPETRRSVTEFKKSEKVGGEPNKIDPDFFAALISRLRAKRFKQADIEKKSITKGATYKTDSGPVDLTSVQGGNEYLIYMVHQQGAAGASWLVNSMLGKGDKMPPWRNLNGNIPDKLYPGLRAQIKAAYDSGDYKKAATLFLNMWKNRFLNIKKDINGILNEPKNNNIKQVLATYANEIPLETLGTFAYIESGLNPNAGNSTYKGLFALNPSTASKYNSNLNSSNVKDPVENTKAAVGMIKANTQSFLKSVGSDAISALKLKDVAGDMA